MLDELPGKKFRVCPPPFPPMPPPPVATDIAQLNPPGSPGEKEGGTMSTSPDSAADRVSWMVKIPWLGLGMRKAEACAMFKLALQFRVHAWQINNRTANRFRPKGNSHITVMLYNRKVICYVHYIIMCTT